MPVMSRVERAFCRRAPWEGFTGRVVLPWLLGDTELRSRILEIGSGAGAKSQALLERHESFELTATDLDPLEAAGFDGVEVEAGKGAFRFRSTVPAKPTAIA